MTNKGIIAALLVAIALGGVIYVAMPKGGKVAETPTGVTTKEESEVVISATTNQTPTSSSSDDEIVDYLVNDLVKDETAAAKAAIDTTAPKSQADASANLGAGL